MLGNKHSEAAKEKMREARINPEARTEKLRQAVALYIQGIPMSKASETLGFNSAWLSSCKFKNKDLFDDLCEKEIDILVRSVISPAMRKIASGTTPEQTSQDLKLARDYLTPWIDNHFSECLEILKELRDQQKLQLTICQRALNNVSLLKTPE